ncbi:TonB-dependent receptor plug domain-containing protein [Hyphobacterium sp.]|uniref:TonB-dependent receptor plug domain-containing protein n=1 Tax=Hyphobacterium sp. TaxID=2004662 RepID=UPI003BAA558F
MASTLIGGLGLAAPAMAQDAADEVEDRVVVTGSRLLTNPNVTSPSPVLSVGQEEVDVRGNVRIEDFINILPQVFAGQAAEVSNGASGTATLNLRGLGSVRTLVMVDGRRLPYGASNIISANLDLIPSQLVERVDILTGGASAVYGSDAVGGVANFILRNDFEGVEVGYQAGIHHNGNGVEPYDSVLAAGGQPVPSAAWDGEEFLVHMTMGTNTPDGRGNVTIFAAYEDREQISQADRSISGCALGQSTGAGSFGGFGCIGSANFRLFGGPGGFGFQQTDGTIDNFFTTPGPVRTFNFGPFNFFQRPSTRFQTYARGVYAITDSVEAFADFSFTNNKSDAQIAPTASFGIGAYSINCDNPFIQGNAGIPLTTIFGCSAADIAAGNIVSGITASHRNVEGGPRNSGLENSAWRFVGGLRGELFEHWNWELFAQYGRTEDQQTSTNDFVVANLQQAFLVRNVGGTPQCIDPSGGCVPYNIFQRGANGESLVTQAALNFIHGIGISIGETEQLVYGGNIQADLGNYGMVSPFADEGVQFLFGMEYRDDDLVRTPDEISQVPGGGFTGVGGATLPVAGSLNSIESYTEFQAPLVMGRPGVEELTLSGQYRFSHYEADGNNTQNTFETHAYGIQLGYTPIPDLRLRAQYQRAVRAPNVIELFTGQNTGLPNLSPAGTNSAGQQLFDPCASANPIRTLQECARTGVTAAQYGTILDVISGQTQSLTGGNPNLDPETADTYTFGFVATPSAVPGLTVSVDYFTITVEDTIAAGIPAQTILDRCLDTGDATFCSLITRSSTGSLAAGTFGVGFQQTNVNIAELSTEGVDLQASYVTDLGDLLAALDGFGGLRVDYASTYLMTLDTTPFPGAAVIECAGFFGNNCGTPGPEYRHRLAATWDTPWDVAATVTWRYFGGTDNDNVNDTVEPTLDAVNYIDFSANWSFSDRVGIRGGILNAFNEQAPVFTGAGPALGNGNTYPTVYDTGRFLFGSITLNY